VQVSGERTRILPKQDMIANLRGCFTQIDHGLIHANMSCNGYGKRLILVQERYGNILCAAGVSVGITDGTDSDARLTFCDKSATVSNGNARRNFVNLYDGCKQSHSGSQGQGC